MCIYHKSRQIHNHKQVLLYIYNMYQIVCNEKGSRTLAVMEEHLETIEKHNLFSDLLDSNGIVDENVLEKLRLNVRSMLNTEHPDAELLKLCQDLLFHDNMKARGLHELILLFIEWEKEKLESLKPELETESES